MINALASRVVGFLAGVGLGLGSCATWAVVSDPAEYMPAFAVAAIPLDVRPLTYRRTARGCGNGYIQGYVASDGANAWATNMLPLDPNYPAQGLERLGQPVTVISGERTTGSSGELRTFQLLVELNNPAPDASSVVLYTFADGYVLAVGGPAERYVRDVERIERGDGTLLREWPRPSAPN